MRMSILASLLFSILLLSLSGCISTSSSPDANSRGLGFKTTDQCDQLSRISQKISCYHTAAITLAYIGSGTEDKGVGAEKVCKSIYTKFGEPNKENDIGYRAITERNNCLFDVARISGNIATCSGIKNENQVASGLFGDKSSQDMCIDEAKKTAALNQLQQNLNSDINKDSLCNLFFILLPLILIGTLAMNARNR